MSASRNSARDLELLLEHLSAVLGFIDPQTPWKKSLFHNSCPTSSLVQATVSIFARRRHFSEPGTVLKAKISEDFSEGLVGQSGEILGWGCTLRQFI